MSFYVARRGALLLAGVAVGWAIVSVTFAGKPGGGGGKPGSGGGSFPALIYALDAEDPNQMLAIDSSTTTPLGFGLTMEPSHVTHAGKHWYLRQLVRQVNGQYETNPDGTDRYSLALFDGVDVVWITPPANVSVSPKFKRTRPRWVAADSAVSYLGVDYSNYPTLPPTGGLYRTEITWNVAGVPEFDSHAPLVATEEVFVSETIILGNPPTPVDVYEVSAIGIDWNRDGTQYVIGREFRTQEGETQLWLGDLQSAPIPLLDGSGAAVAGIRPEWARGGNPIVDGTEIEAIACQRNSGIWTIGEDGLGATLVAESYWTGKDGWHDMEQPHWAPDGSQLIFDHRYVPKNTLTERSSVYRVSRGGNQTRELIDANQLYGVAWRTP